jgi:hypothetical protein
MGQHGQRLNTGTCFSVSSDDTLVLFLFYVGYRQFLELIQLNIGVFYCNSFYEREQACDYFFYLLVSPILFLRYPTHP